MTNWDKRWSEGDTPWDHAAPAPPLRELLATALGCRLKGRKVLVPGCGSGEDVRLLAEEGARSWGLDISPTAIEQAESKPGSASVTFESGSFFDYSEQTFDAIWEHTCFCAIEPEDRIRYVEACARLIRPGGCLTGVFYLEPWRPGEVQNPPPYRSEKSEIIELFSPHFDLIWEKVPDLCYPGREGREWLAVFERKDFNRGVAV